MIKEGHLNPSKRLLDCIIKTYVGKGEMISVVDVRIKNDISSELRALTIQVESKIDKEILYIIFLFYCILCLI